jgi:hypothetical protein
LAGAGAELGKTSQAFVFADNYMKTMPRSKTIYVKAEARLTPEMKKRSGLTFVDSGNDWNYGTVFVFSCNEFETIAELLERLYPSMHDAGEYLCVILDSIDGLILREDKKKNVWNEKESPRVAGVPLLTKLLFRRIALPINHYDGLFLATTQYSSPIKIDPYTRTEKRQVEGSGGAAIAHQSDFVFYYQQRYISDYILENPDVKPDSVKNKTLGVYVNIEIKKGANETTGEKIRIPIKKGRVGSSIWVEKEIVDMALMWGLISKAGSWFSFEESICQEMINSGIIKEQIKIQGMVGLNEIFENDEKIREFFIEKMRNILSE